MKQWYEELFENYSRTYDKESFVQGTPGEVDFIEQEIGCDKTKRILDIGCGTGRHAIELAHRGYSVTGIDLSDAQLARAREKAALAGVHVEFHRLNACNLPFEEEFDCAIMICEGGFPLMESDELNYAILANAAKALRSPGKLILTTLNALYPLYHNVKELLSGSPSGVRTDACSFDLMTFRDHEEVTVTDDSGTVKNLTCNERFYVPSEISWYLRSLGFHTVGIYGCTLGKFSRNDALTTEDFEMLVVGER